MGVTSTGTVLGGRYELTRRIAAGGMGEVWRGTDRILGREVAIKVVKEGLIEDEAFRTRFQNEARLAARLAHGNITQVYDFGEDLSTAYLVMELVDGATVADLTRAGAAPLDQVVDLVTAAAAGLDAAHELGMVHRDVKPANLLLTPKGVVKVTDFGIARALGEAKLTSTGEVVGTAQYMAPEAALGHTVDAQADVYALAVTTYELLCGRRPFMADSAVSLAMQHIHNDPPPLPAYVPPQVAAAVLRGLAKDPWSRPRGATAFASELAAAADASHTAAIAPTGTAHLIGPPPISQPQSVSSNTPPVFYAQPQQMPMQQMPQQLQPWEVSSPYVRPKPTLPPGGPVARGLGLAWIVLGVLTALMCALPFVELGDQSWSTFALAEPATHAGAAEDASDNGVGWAIAIPMLLVALMGIPAARGKGTAVWAVLAVPGCLWAALMTLVAYVTVFPEGASDTPVTTSAGAVLLPWTGALTLFVIVLAMFKRR